MWKARIITKWVDIGETRVFDAARFLRPKDSMTDVTGEVIPVDSPVIVEILSLDGTAIDAIVSDRDYGDAAVLTCEEVQYG